MSGGRVEILYGQLKDRAIDFRIRPGERINEVALARELNASRTPLREALNRLVAEQLIEFQPGKGFFCRGLDASSVFDLYEMRMIVEEAAVRRACARASDSDLQGLREGPYADSRNYAGKSIRDVTRGDEAFHTAIAKLSGNREIARQLERINERIRFIRWIDMAERVQKTKHEHTLIMDAIQARDADKAVMHMRAHITKRMDQIVACVREGFSNIYVTAPEDVFAQPAQTAGRGS